MGGVFFGMSRRTRLVAVLLLLLAVLASLVWTALFPRVDLQPLPRDLVDLQTSAGQTLLAEADGVSDYPALAAHFQSQWLISYCGVASSVAVLTAMGAQVTQHDFFTTASESVRPRWRVVIAGMSLDELGGLLDAHGVDVTVRHADAFDAQAFREVVARNLARAGDYLIVNYDREMLGQLGSGHISPLAAYDVETDMVLVMDTAAYRYPQTWVPLASLYDAMATKNSGSDQMRGYAEVRGLGPN